MNTAEIPLPEVDRDVVPVTHDVVLVQTLLVNVFLIGERESDDWVLVDAGLAGFAGRIRHAAERRFGRKPPKAIVLTHGHFDHIGSLQALLEHWGADIPIYAHELEAPYLDGRSSYPPPDPTVGGGLVARSSPLYPRSPIDVGRQLRYLPDDGSIPPLPGWRWIHTPGHTPGHVSLFRDDDGLLLPGDAFCSQKQESLLAVLTNHGALHGPPAYFTTNWPAAADSVRRLAALEPEVAAPSHGLPVHGHRLREQLPKLAEHFEQTEIPRDGRYVREPARSDRNGPQYVPPPVADPLPKLAAGFAIGAMIGLLLARRR